MATIAATGADYTTFNSWYAAIGANPSTAQTGTATGSTDLASTEFALDKPNSNAVTIKLTADSSNRVNAPTYSAMTSKARISSKLQVSTSNHVIEYLGIIGSTSAPAVVNQSDTDLILRNCVIGGRIQGDFGSTGILKATNLAIFGDTGGPAVRGFFGKVDLYHCSVFSAYTSTEGACWNLSGTCNSYATVVVGSSVCYTNTWGGDYNVSSDATAPGTNYLRSVSGLFKNTTAGSEDFELRTWWKGYYDVPDYSGSADVGTDLAGVTRSGYIDPGVSQGAATLDLTNGCVHYFKFEDNLNDEVGATALTNSGSGYTATAKLGSKALDCSGGSKRVTLSDANFNAPTTAMTVAFWYRNVSSSVDKGLIGKGTNTDESWSIISVGTSDLRAYIANSSDVGQIVDSPTALGGSNLTGEYHFCVLSYDAGVAQIFFYRTASSYLQVRTTTGLPTSLNDSAEDFEIGRARTDYGTLDADTYFDSVGIWNRAINGAEIAALLNGGTGADPTFGGGATGQPTSKRFGGVPFMGGRSVHFGGTRRW